MAVVIEPRGHVVVIGPWYEDRVSCELRWGDGSVDYFSVGPLEVADRLHELDYRIVGIIDRSVTMERV